jgi:hypothetical protein
MVIDRLRGQLSNFLKKFLKYMIVLLIILFIIMLIPFFSWGFKGIILGSCSILFALGLAFVRIYLEEYFDMVKPGGIDFQRIIICLLIVGILILLLSFLSLFEAIPWFTLSE